MEDRGEQQSRIEAISTRWTLLRKAHEGPSDTAVDARNALVLRYQPAVRRYVGALVRNDQEADDLAQDVMLRLLAGDFGGADPDRGRFRDLLKVAIRNMVRNRWKQQKRRRAVDFDVAQVGASPEEDEGRWLSEWRQSVLNLAWKAMEQKEQARPGSMHYTLLRLRIDCPNDTSEQLAVRLFEKLGQTVRADAVRQKLRRARLEFADLLISEIAKGLRDPSPEKIEEELAALGLIDLMRELLPADWKRSQR